MPSASSEIETIFEDLDRGKYRNRLTHDKTLMAIAAGTPITPVSLDPGHCTQRYTIQVHANAEIRDSSFSVYQDSGFDGSDYPPDSKMIMASSPAPAPAETLRTTATGTSVPLVPLDVTSGQVSPLPSGMYADGSDYTDSGFGDSLSPRERDPDVNPNGRHGASAPAEVLSGEKKEKEKKKTPIAIEPQTKRSRDIRLLYSLSPVDRKLF